ncbi:hypothetical protein CFC21_105017 [Triticum aestivum]|uniref:F-box domain-containing protein n=2 Tax=Triticum aestivum TaxID=4565 RepID=A0A9R1MBB4_WHEAT|nr:hypothetical protein CFC21_105017 [Triticum aestivum]
MAAERLADDLLVEILARVPARSVCRFKCVSKDWLSLIDHPDHHRKLPQTLAGFFYARSDNRELPLETEVRFAGVSGNRCPPVDTSFAFLPSHRRVDLLDCCNGLLLCRWYGVSALGDEFCYIVCNPATKEWVSLPDRSHENKVGIERLGFDPTMSSHFYVFVLLENVNFNAYLAEVEVYSSETKRWVYKEIGWNKRIVLPAEQPSAVFLNGCLHFYSFDHETYNCLAVVDTKGETWMPFGVPGGLVDGFVQQSQGYLHYANFQNDGHSDVVRQVVYVLEDYDSQEWIMKHNIEEMSYIFGGINSLLNGDFIWIAIHPECNLVFFNVGRDTTLICYNMDRRQVVCINVCLNLVLIFSHCCMHGFKF